MQERAWPRHGWVGLALVAAFWTLNWALPGTRTLWGFFPMWLGYCLTVDALVVLRKGSSLLTRSRGAYVGLFVASVPGWWLFEAINVRTQNWRYLGTETLPSWQFALMSSLSFSTVFPAVLGTAELASTFGWIRRARPGPRIRPTLRTTVAIFIAGWAMLAALLVWPRYFYPLVWVSLCCILEPLNVWLRRRALSHHTAEGDWRPLLALWVGVLICGFFWEFWNYYSYPKWVYHVPFFGRWHIFEMPLLGYLGYVPFSVEVFALYHFITGLLGAPSARDYIQIVPDGIAARGGRAWAWGRRSQGLDSSAE